MTHFIRCRRRGEHSAGGDRSGHRLLSVALLIGAAAGSIYGCFMCAPPSEDLAEFAAGSFPLTVRAALAWPGMPLISAGVFSTSFLGVVLEPLLAFWGAFRFSRSIAVMYAAYGAAGLRAAFFAAGLPALVWLPAFAVCVYFGFLASRRLWALRFGVPCGIQYGAAPLAVGLALAAEALCTVYDLTVLPTVLSRIS